MARRKNIFDFATKELTATAFWAWVLDAETSDDVTLKAINADLRTKLDIPQHAELVSIELEKNPDDPGLKSHSSFEEDDCDSRNRIDILATYRLSDNGGHLYCVIENKIRRDTAVLGQVAGYRDRLQKRVTGAVRAFVFTFDDTLATSSLAENRSISIFPLSEMVALLDPYRSDHVILKDYSDFLKDKLTKASAFPVRRIEEDNPANRAKWSIVAAERGITSLIETYEAAAHRLGFSITHAKGRSIYLSIVNNRPIVSIRPLKSSPVHGLRFGVSITNLVRTHNASLTRGEMPRDFAWQKERQANNEWRFGYLGPEDIERILRMIAEKVSRE